MPRRPFVCRHGWLVSDIDRLYTCPECRPCRNGRHDHEVRQGQSCDRRLPPAPLVHQAVGSAAVWGLVGLGGAFVAGWRAGEWLATEGRLRLELARARFA